MAGVVGLNDDDVDYLSNYKPDHLYVHPAANGTGAYVTLLAENEELLFETEITERSRLAVSLFYLNEKRDFNTVKLTKLRRHGSNWRKDGEVSINHFHRNKLKEFIQLLSALDFSCASKTRISVESLDINNLASVLNTDRSRELIKQLAHAPELSEDIFALAHKKQALQDFEKLLNQDQAFKEGYVSRHCLNRQGEEAVWQHFFESNPWIFGHGLNYVFLDKVNQKLETITTGASHNTSGNRVDALMRTRAAISQYVLIELKTPSAPLLQSKPYRSGCWSVSHDLTDAVSQIQKTAFDFTSNQFPKVQLKNQDGSFTGDEIFRVQPKSYLIIGQLNQLKGHDDKFTCFQLFRGSLGTPEILTYDELYERAKCIVETISGAPAVPSGEPTPIDDDIPF
jgi:hypothetical protein